MDSLDDKSMSKIKRDYTDLKKSKKTILRQKEKLENQLKVIQDKIEQEEVERKKEEVSPNSPDHHHVGFLHASPIFYRVR